MEKSITDNKALAEFIDGIYEIAAWGFDQQKAQEWARQKVEEAIKKHTTESQEVPKNFETDTKGERDEI